MMVQSKNRIGVNGFCALVNMGSSYLAILLLTLTVVEQHFLFVQANPAVLNSGDTESVVMDNPFLSGSRGIRKKAVLAMAPAKPLFQKDPEAVYSGLQRNAFSLVTGSPASVKCSSAAKDAQLTFGEVINDSFSDLEQFLTAVLDKGEFDSVRACSETDGESLATVHSESRNIVTNHQWADEKFKL